MPETATASPDVDPDVLDELVPPPGPAWRRALRWAAFLTVVGVAVWAVSTGTVVPHLGNSQVESWGGPGPVQISLRTTNRSRVDIEVTGGPRARPGLRLLGYQLGPSRQGVNDGAERTPSDLIRDPFPLRLGPGSTLELTVWFAVTDCGAVGRTSSDDNSVDLQIALAAGPLSRFTRTHGVDAKDLALDGPASDAESWPVAMAQYACPDQQR